MSESNSNEGGSTCIQQVNTPETPNKRKALPTSNIWLCLQNNNNNAYYLSLVDGNSNNNNKNNAYQVLAVESPEFVDFVFWAEEDCWSNKHSSWDANKYHYSQGKRIFEFIQALRDGTYKPWRSICFVILKPKPREVFAAHYQDRIAHHIIAPYMMAVAEAIHNENGNVSFGNRKKVSAFHACLHIQALMKEHPDGIIATFDIKGFFMSIDKDMAWEIFANYENTHRPEGITDAMREWLLNLIHQLILHDPVSNCERHSPLTLWDLIPKNKSLFYMHGIPIGNYYAQIIANLILEVVMAKTLEYNPTEFVDDIAYIIDTIDQLRELRVKIREGIANIKLRLNENKQYVQPVRHGVSWCGFTIYPNRIYVNNRAIHNFLYKLDTRYQEPTIEKARRLVQTANSYTGTMSHCNEYNTQRYIRDKIMAMGYDKFLDVREEPNHIIYNLKKEYKQINVSIEDYRQIDKVINQHKKQKNMIVMPVPANSPHYEKAIGRFTYRYGYQAIQGDDQNVNACVEESTFRYKEPVIKQKVQTYCAQVGIPDEWNPADYGFES